MALGPQNETSTPGTTCNPTSTAIGHSSGFDRDRSDRGNAQASQELDTFFISSQSSLTVFFSLLGIEYLIHTSQKLVSVEWLGDI